MIVLDTHVVLWLAFDPERISQKARAAIDSARRNGDGLAISEITLLELAALVNQGRVRLDIGLESFLQEIEARFVVLPISGRACVRAIGLPATYPKDPADWIVGATASVRGHRGPCDPTFERPSHDLVRGDLRRCLALRPEGGQPSDRFITFIVENWQGDGYEHGPYPRFVRSCPREASIWQGHHISHL